MNITQVRCLYESGCSQREIGLRFNMPQASVSRFMRNNGVQTRKPYKSWSRYRVCQLYKSGMSQNEIAIKLGVSRAAVYRAMKARGVNPRTNAEASSLMNKRRFPGFNWLQEQLVYGSLLGDACLCRSVMKSNKTGRRLEIFKLLFSHSKKQLAYLKHKRSIIGGSAIGTRQSGLGSTIYHFAFSHTPTLRQVASVCHDRSHKKKVSDTWLSKIDWPALAFWYQDDGFFIFSHGRPLLTFCTNSFSYAELTKLQSLLLRFGLDTRRVKTTNGRPRARMLSSRHASQALIFLRRIKPYVVPCMEYKIRAILHGRATVAPPPQQNRS